ncbi:hypothetical protein KC19_4G246200 [Ceratodon purpureus]|uniref:Uncharacterized protein n=1 Tax=Ceratodon purpureus TaxID=3225 RepID=A0A8T0IFV3_CERPU|nr:hypothetical protein KC19_4G246200 [Ceratodon purpureus]
MATFVAEQRALAPLKHRKWWNKGTKGVEQRYSKSTVQAAVKAQGYQGLVPLLGLHKQQNRVTTKRKFKPKRRVPRTVPRAPFNDSSFLMRVRRSGGLASLISPAPSSPSVFQSSDLDLVAYQDFLDHEDYGYGSMAGLIRLRRPEEEKGDSDIVDNSFDDVNMCASSLGQNLEQRVDRFEMMDLPREELEASQRVASRDSRIRDLEDENLVLKDRLFLVQQEVNELRERLRGQSRNSVEENDSTQSCLES